MPETAQEPTPPFATLTTGLAVFVATVVPFNPRFIFRFLVLIVRLANMSDTSMMNDCSETVTVLDPVTPNVVISTVYVPSMMLMIL